MSQVDLAAAAVATSLMFIGILMVIIGSATMMGKLTVRGMIISLVVVTLVIIYGALRTI